MHEILKYYRNINLCNFKSDALRRYIYISKITTNMNSNSKIDRNFNLFISKSFIVEFGKVDAIQYTLAITKPTRYYIFKITCLIK